MVKSSAFTLIELIFAIVIIAISVVSLPRMNQVISKGADINLIQEAIFAAATTLNEAVTLNWDEASIDGAAPNSYARVVDHTGNCNSDSNSSTYRQMPGHINQPLHRKCLADSTIIPVDAGNDVNIDALDDIDDGGVSKEIFTLDLGGAAGYKRDYNSSITVDRNVTFNTPDNLDMKRIIITITDENANILTKLTTYSANIGEVDYLKKEY